MRRYGIWKYTLIIFVLLMGLIYALPNLYAPDPSVQVSYNNSSQETDSSLLRRIEVLLNDSKEKLPTYQIEQNQDFVLVRLSSNEEQLNIKRLHNIIFGSPYKSQIKVLQSIGRGLRRTADKTECNLFDISDDLSYNNRSNFTLKHLEKRVEIYNQEEFDYEIIPVKLKQ